MYKAVDIANWFIKRAIQDVQTNGGEYITHLKLQKLLYFAQGCYSAMEGKPLFKEKIYAWAHGPVVSAIYPKLSPVYRVLIHSKESPLMNTP